MKVELLHEGVKTKLAFNGRQADQTSVMLEKYMSDPSLKYKFEMYG